MPALEKIWTVFDTPRAGAGNIDERHTNRGHTEVPRPGAEMNLEKLIMKSLFAAVAAVAILAALAGSSVAIDYNSPFPPFAALGGETRLIYPATPVELLVTEAESGGQFGMVMIYNKPDEGPPGDNALLENKLTETYYVLEGTFRFTVGDEVYVGGPGTVVVSPPKVPHGFLNVGDTVGKLMVLTTPVDTGSMKGTDFYVEWASQSTRSAEWIAKTNSEYGIERPAP